MMMKKSSLQGSGPVWALKADCPLFGRDGRTQSPSHPPSSGQLNGPWPACAICQSHRGDRKSRAPNSLCPFWSLRLFSFSLEGDAELEICSCSLLIFISSLYQQPPLGDSKLLSFFWRETHWPLYHKTLLLSQFWPPSEQLSPHPQSYVPTRESAVEKQCQGGSQLCSVAIATLARKLRYDNPAGTLTCPHLFPLHPCRTRTNELQRRRKPEHNQPVYVLFSRPVRLAGLAVIVIESLTGWSSVSALPQNCSLLSGIEGSSKIEKLKCWDTRKVTNDF